MGSQTISVVGTNPLFQMSAFAKGANTKYRQILMIVLSSVASVATAQTTPVAPHPPNAVSQTGWATYHVIDLGPVVRSPPGQPNSIANTSVVAGTAPMPNGTVRAVLWYGGSLMDLGVNRLGGPNSEALGVNDRGQIVGAGQTSDPNNEDFCGFGALGLPASATACRAFVWQNGMISILPNTLGGANSVANLINNQGDVAGFAETDKQELGCPVNSFAPVVWRGGKIQQLPMPAGDHDGGAFGINEKGQAVGASGSCTPFNPNSGTYLLESPCRVLGQRRVIPPTPEFRRRRRVRGQPRLRHQ